MVVGFDFVQVHPHGKNELQGNLKLFPRGKWIIPVIEFFRNTGGMPSHLHKTYVNLNIQAKSFWQFLVVCDEKSYIGSHFMIQRYNVKNRTKIKYFTDIYRKNYKYRNPEGGVRRNICARDTPRG